PGAGPRSSSAPGQPSGRPPSTPPSSGGGVVPPPSVTPATTMLVVGPGCPGLAGGGGYYTVGNGSSSGWGDNGSGGWSGDGTNGSNRALWYFGSGTAGFASCTVSVYVPWDGKATDTGGTAAEYQIVEGSAETYVTSFTVNQNATHGQWVTLGTVAVGGQTVKV